jgi:hypothetical protein
MKATILKYELKVSKTNQTYGVYTVLADGVQSNLSPSQYFKEPLVIGKSYEIELYTSPATQRSYINKAVLLPDGIVINVPVQNVTVDSSIETKPIAKKWINYPKKETKEEPPINWDKKNADIKIQTIIKAVCEFNGHRPDVGIETVGEQVVYLFRLSNDLLDGKIVTPVVETKPEEGL